MPIKRDHEQVQALDRRERDGGIIALEDGVAERAAHILEYRRAPEKLIQLRRQL